MQRVDYFIIRHIVSSLRSDKRDKHDGVNSEGARCRGVLAERKGKEKPEKRTREQGAVGP